MEILPNSEDDIMILSLIGDFDTTEVDNYAAEVSATIEAGIVKILLDLGEMPFINSTGLGALLKSQKLLSQFGGGVAVAMADSRVEKVFRQLGLDQRIPLFGDLAEGKAHLAGLSPETVSGTGEEVEFFRSDAEETFGTRPRRGRVEELHEGGLIFTFENLDDLDPARAFPPDATVMLRFKLPLYHPTHVFKDESRILGHEVQGPETILVQVEFVGLSEVELEAIKQYVEDRRLLGGDA